MAVDHIRNHLIFGIIALALIMLFASIGLSLFGKYDLDMEYGV